MADLTLEPFDDKQLRVVKFTLPEGEAQIPVYCIFYRSGKDEYVKIAPAVGLYPEQATRLEYHFGVHNEWKKRDQFLIQRRHLSSLTFPVQGVTPSYYYRWPGKDVPPPNGEKLRIQGEEIQPIPDDAENFLDYVHKKRGVDRNILRLAWSAVSKEAASWLLKKRKPINLGFVNIYAVPYRANWKEILLAKFPNALWWFKHNVNKEGKFKDHLAHAEFQRELTDLSLMAIHGRDHYIHWTMEAVPSEQWEADAAELEMTRKAGGNTAYVRHHEKTVQDILPRVLQVFTNYIKATSRSFPAVRSGPVDGSQKLIPYRGKTDNVPTFGKNLIVRIVTSDAPKLGRGSEFEPVQAAHIKGLQNMPRLLPSNDDMRRSVEQRNVAESANGANRAGWLSVPDDTESKTEGQPVLVEHSEQRPDGVVRGAD